VGIFRLPGQHLGLIYHIYAHRRTRWPTDSNSATVILSAFLILATACNYSLFFSNKIVQNIVNTYKEEKTEMYARREPHLINVFNINKT